MTNSLRNRGVFLVAALSLSVLAQGAAPCASPGIVWPATWLRQDARRVESALRDAAANARPLLAVVVPPAGPERAVRLAAWRDYVERAPDADLARLAGCDVIAATQADLARSLAALTPANTDTPLAWWLLPIGARGGPVRAVAVHDIGERAAELESFLAPRAVGPGAYRRARWSSALAVAGKCGDWEPSAAETATWRAERLRARTLPSSRCGLEAFRPRSRCDSSGFDD